MAGCSSGGSGPIWIGLCNMKLFTQLLSTTEKENKRLHEEWLDAAITYKVEWERELERRRRFNIEAESPLPHPDDIVINMNTGQVEIKGPITKEDKIVWDKLKLRREDCERSIAEDEQLLRDEPDCPYRAHILDNIDHEKRIRAMITKAIGETKS